MAAPEAALAHYEQQLNQAEATLILVRRQWRKMTPDDLERSWAQIVRRLTVLVQAGMLGAAKAGAAYVSDVLDSPAPADSVVVTAALAQTASDGRPLDSLLYSAVVHAKHRIGTGAPAADALDTAGKWLDTLARTQVADAGRGATGLAITARPHVGYVRLVAPPCCQRCAVLSGKRFKWNQGFQRHPSCDCRHVPCEDDADPETLSPPVRPDQVKDLTVAQRRAIDDGGDMGQVINSHRANSRSKSGLYTSEGTTRRGTFGGYERTPDGSLRRRAKGETTRRLTPEGIYRLTSSREEAVRLLHQYGYLSGDEVLAARRLRAHA